MSAFLVFHLSSSLLMILYSIWSILYLSFIIPTHVDVERSCHSRTALSQFAPARLGERLNINAMQLVCSELGKGFSAKIAAEVAHIGVEGTRDMCARLGRATYVGMNSDDAKELSPDPCA